jgi:hypothetical protein
MQGGVIRTLTPRATLAQHPGRGGRAGRPLLRHGGGQAEVEGDLGSGCIVASEIEVPIMLGNMFAVQRAAVQSDNAAEP